ncbi:PIN domain-containing protein [Streptomyces exfoliatus]|uniref:PIN domain-containing protein n=1 Tax=Streptomyces exfoliatus TaxID=1905 RepID=UPI0004638282|nr:PIN domain-containing protein [Streptomyces exfoliatus]
MIILDANILKGTSLRGPAADVLRAIRAAGGERVAAPWIAMEEVAAQQALAYTKKHDAAMDAVNELRKATPWSDVPHPKRWPADRVRRHWRERYASLAETIETSPAAYQMAMFREANLIAPCKTVNSGRHKVGARDAAIWLTAIEYARANPTETVYFVSNNTEDFGDGMSFPEPMDRDLAGLEGRFFLFTSLDGVLGKFATELEASAADVEALLDTEESRLTVTQAAWATSQRYTVLHGSKLLGESDEPRTVTLRRRWGPTAVALDKVLEVSAREVAGHKWYTASVRWLLAEDESPWGYTGERVAYAWETRVLLSPTASDKGLTVLDSKRPSPVSREDIPNVPPVTEEGELVLLGAAKRSGLLDSTPEFRPLLRRLARQATDLAPLEAALARMDSTTPGREAYERFIETAREVQAKENGNEA